MRIVDSRIDAGKAFDWGRYTDEMMRLVKQLTLNMPEDNYMTRQYL